METKVDENLQNKVALERPKLPTIEELYREADLPAVSKYNTLNQLLNQPPAPTWIKMHPMIKIKKGVDESGKEIYEPLKYLPIERIEWLLRRIFVVFNVEIKYSQQIFNACVVAVRLEYLDPISGNMFYQDGIGAVEIQTEKGAKPGEFDKIKSAAVQKAMPAAESFAIKDAAEKIGKIFGGDLNRADNIGYDMLETKFKERTDKPLN